MAKRGKIKEGFNPKGCKKCLYKPDCKDLWDYCPYTGQLSTPDPENHPSKWD